MGRNRLLFVAGATLLLGVLWRRETRVVRVSDRPPIPSVDRTDQAVDPPTGLVDQAAPVRRPGSLRGTASDGAGRFVPTIDARRFFDYFLTATGEVSPAALRQRIVGAIEHRLAPTPAHEAITLLDRYLAYRDEARARSDTLAAGGDLGDRLAQVVRLRREMLGTEVADAFFAAEEAEAERAITRRAIAEDATLTADERRARLAAVDADTPPEVQEARSVAVLAQTLQDAEAAARERGASAGEVQRLREGLVGPEAAARLAALDDRRAEWQARVESVRAERARVLADPRLAEDARAVAVDHLLRDRFTPTERLRVEALETDPNTTPAPAPQAAPSPSAGRVR